MMRRVFQAAVAAIQRIAPIAPVVFIAMFVASPPFAPSSPCAAPPSHHHAAEYLVFFSVSAVLCSFFLTSGVRLHLAVATVDGSLRTVGARTKATLRLLSLLAVGFSTAGSGFALAACHYLLQMKYGLLACMSAAVRGAVYAAYVIVGAGCACSYGSFATIALFSE